MKLCFACTLVRYSQQLAFGCCYLLFVVKTKPLNTNHMFESHKDLCRVMLKISHNVHQTLPLPKRWKSKYCSYCVRILLSPRLK